ncbi:MAG TPA: cytochrome P450 [Solirubrobacterales bacterium]|nr:cytochrome P450 [Solirubrobacterales bacterium]
METLLGQRTGTGRGGRSPLPPGPRLPAAAQAVNWTFRPGPFLERCQREHGDVFTLHLDMGGSPRVLIAEPGAADLLARPSQTSVPDARASIRPVFGPESVLMAEGEEHKRRRQEMLPAFRRPRLESYRETIEAAVDRELETWPLGRPFPLRPRFQALTLAAIVEVIFARSDARRREQIGEQIDRLLARFGHRGAGFAITLPGWVRALGSSRLARWREGFDAAVLAEVARRRAGPLDPGDDVLSRLVVAAEDGRMPLGDAAICDQVCTLLLAGHETTATALAWSVEHLTHEPEAFGRLRAEVAESPAAGERYAQAVAREALRLNPPLPNTQRQLTEAASAGGYELPKGTLVAASAYLIQRRADLYPEPLAFRPERFLGAAPAPEAWWAFGGGSRRCVGAGFAVFQMGLVLRRLCERTRLEAAADRREPIRKRGILFAPAHGARVVMTERRPAR